MNKRWGISVDIEGFSKNYEYSEERKTYAIQALSELMAAIYQIGCDCYPGKHGNNFADRLFAHQFGDGFIILSNYPEGDISRAVAIAIALMRHMILSGYATKAAISTGDMTDIKGCYPEAVCDGDKEHVGLGMGLMTIIPVMGTALTKAHKLAGTVSGSVLILDAQLACRICESTVKFSNKKRNCIDWVCSEIPLADDIAKKSNLLVGSAEFLHQKLNDYCSQTPKPPKNWIESTFAHIDGYFA